MAAEENKALVHRFLEEVIGRGNPNAADALCTSNFTWHGGSSGDVPDLVTFKGLLSSFFTGFPDLRVENEEMVAEGDKVVSRYRWHGTQRGEFFGIPPTNKRVTVAGISMYRVADGKLVEEWWQEDMLGLMQQLGVVPSPEAAPA